MTGREVTRHVHEYLRGWLYRLLREFISIFAPTLHFSSKNTLMKGCFWLVNKMRIDFAVAIKVNHSLCAAETRRQQKQRYAQATQLHLIFLISGLEGRFSTEESFCWSSLLFKRNYDRQGPSNKTAQQGYTYNGFSECDLCWFWLFIVHCSLSSAQKTDGRKLSKQSALFRISSLF